MQIVKFVKPHASTRHKFLADAEDYVVRLKSEAYKAPLETRE